MVDEYIALTVSDELYHHGVKGMKWYQHIFGKNESSGRRKGSSDNAGEVSIRKSGKIVKKKGSTPEAEVKAMKAKAREDIKKMKVKAQAKIDKKAVKAENNKSVAEMSDEELQAKINRIRKEQEYYNLIPKKQKLGSKILGDVRDVVVPAAKRAGQDALTDYFRKKFKEVLGDDEKKVLDKYEEAKRDMEYAQNIYKKNKYEHDLNNMKQNAINSKKEAKLEKKEAKKEAKQERKEKKNSDNEYKQESKKAKKETKFEKKEAKRQEKSQEEVRESYNAAKSLLESAREKRNEYVNDARTKAEILNNKERLTRLALDANRQANYLRDSVSNTYDYYKDNGKMTDLMKEELGRHRDSQINRIIDVNNAATTQYLNDVRNQRQDYSTSKEMIKNYRNNTTRSQRKYDNKRYKELMKQARKY